MPIYHLPCGIEYISVLQEKARKLPFQTIN